MVGNFIFKHLHKTFSLCKEIWSSLGVIFNSVKRQEKSFTETGGIEDDWVFHLKELILLKRRKNGRYNSVENHVK